MFWFLLMVLAVVVFIFQRKRGKSYEFWKHIKAIPGPKSLPIIGTEYHLNSAGNVNILYSNDPTLSMSLISSLYNPTALTDIQKEHFQRDRTLAQQFFPIYRKTALNIAFVCLMHPEDIEIVLSNAKHMEKSIVYNFLHDFLGSGLLTTNGQNYHERRKILNKAFNFTILREFTDIFNKVTEHLVETIKKECHKPYIDVVEPLTEFTLHAIGETSFGVDFLKDRNCSAYKQAVHDYGENFAYRLIRPWLYIPLIYDLSPSGRKHKQNVKALRVFSNNLIKDRNKLIEQNGRMSYPDGKLLGLLDLLLKFKFDGANIDDIGIRDEVDTFILGAHDTTAVSLTNTLMILANEQRVQEEMYQEIISVLKNSTSPSFSDLGELKYMDRCIKESLRLFPSGPWISRVAGEDIKTKTGYTIPKGCNIALFIYDMHRSPELWEHPEKFDPDRFLPENISKRHPFAYIPFSAGTRNCIGQKYAVLEMKSALCGILRNFKLEPVTKVNEVRFKSDYILRPAMKVKVKFVTRN